MQDVILFFLGVRGGEGWFTEHFTVLFKGKLGISLSLSLSLFHTHMHEVKGTCK